METVFFISEKNLRANSLINDNVESTYINNAITTAQVVNLKEVIGSALYNKIKDLIKNQQISDTANAIYKEILDDYIQPYLINRVMSDICVPIAYKFKNQGIVQGNDQHFQSASLNEVQYVQEHYEHLAVFNANRLIEFLLNHKDSITELKHNDDFIKLSQNTTKSQIFFRK